MIPPFIMRDTGEVFGSIFIGSIFLLIASVIAWTIRYELRVRRWLREYPVNHAHAKGTVVSLRDDTEEASTKVHYRFTDARGQTQEGSQAFSRLRSPGLKTGENIAIIYHLGNPSLNYIEGYMPQYRRRETGYIRGFIVMALFLLGFYLWAMR
jgi:hypothetical protein